MRNKIYNFFSDRSAPKEQDPASDEIPLDNSYDRTADLQEALISANQVLKEKEEAFRLKEEAFKEREEAFRQKEEAFKEKEETVRQKEEAFKEREKKLIALENRLSEKEAELLDKAERLNEKANRLNDLQKKLEENKISFEEKPIKSPDHAPIEAVPEIITPENGVSSEILDRLKKLQAALTESDYKDKIIRELHDDLQKKNRNFYAELTRPAIKSIIRIHTFVIGSLKAAEPREGEEAEATLKRARQAMEGNCLMIEDLLNDEFNITMFTPEKGDPYRPKEHTAVISTETEDPELAGTIQECRQPGFKEFETDRIVKSAVVSVYKLKKK